MARGNTERALAFVMACSRTELDTGSDAAVTASGHAVSFASFGDDVWFPGLNATPSYGQCAPSDVGLVAGYVTFAASGTGILEKGASWVPGIACAGEH
jgi:hypothetical protein